MSTAASGIWLYDIAADADREAVLLARILDRHLAYHERIWIPWRDAALAARGSGTVEESSHWNWRAKESHIKGLLGKASFAIECDGHTEGLMIVDNMHVCRFGAHRNLHGVYIDYVETAPWNRPQLTSTPLFAGVGRAFVAVAIQASIDDGNKGRIGLHSLPQSEGFYRDRCGMIDLGPDPGYPNQLRYFEMTSERAAIFLKG